MNLEITGVVSYTGPKSFKKLGREREEGGRGTVKDQIVHKLWGRLTVEERRQLVKGH